MKTSLENRDSVKMNNDSILEHIMLCLEQGCDADTAKIRTACDGRFDAAQCAARIIKQAGDRTDIPVDVLECFVMDRKYIHGELTAWYVAEMIFCGIATLTDNDNQAVALMAGAQ